MSLCLWFFFFFKQKTAYEMRIIDWSSDVCSADLLDGGAGNDNLIGGNGNDILTGSTGADTLNGGAGVDRASYSGSNTGVTVNLTTRTGTGGHAAGDMLVGIEGVIASAFADTLTGSTAATSLRGETGNDTINARPGKEIRIPSRRERGWQ